MNYYEILGLKKDATDKEIKSAYKKLVKKYHPDVYKGDKTFAERKIKEINNAYDTLSNKSLKEEYDNKLNPQPQYTPPQQNTSSYYSNDSSSSSTVHSQNYCTRNYNYTQNYTKNNSDVYYDKVIKKVNSMKYRNQMRLFFAIILLYLLIFLTSLIQLYSTITTSKKNSPQPQTPPPIQSITPENIETPKNDSYYIYNYFTDSQLRNLYESLYSDAFETYDDFLNAYSLYLIQNGY